MNKIISDDPSSENIPLIELKCSLYGKDLNFEDVFRVTRVEPTRTSLRKIRYARIRNGWIIESQVRPESQIDEAWREIEQSAKTIAKNLSDIENADDFYFSLLIDPKESEAVFSIPKEALRFALDEGLALDMIVVGLRRDESGA